MARKNLNGMWSFGAREVRVVGKFAPQGAGVPTIVFPTKRRRFSVVRTAAGLYTVTLADSFFEWTVLSCVLQLATGATRVMQVRLDTQSSTSNTFQIANIDAAAADQDIAANADNTITFEVCAMNSAA